MPTMAKLIAAIVVGALGYVVGGLVAGHLPPEKPEGMLRIIAAFFGALVGWRFLGKRVRGTWMAAAGLGLSSSVALLLVSLGWFSALEMLRRAIRKAYGGNPFEALQDMFEIAFDLARDFLAHPDVIGALVVGGILCGWIAEATGRRWS